MDPSPPYAASCNPPRRAKRPTATGNTLAGTDRVVQSLPPLAPAVSSPTTEATTPHDDNDPIPDVPGPKRRGRKPSTLSRAARESMRRQNHSRIEKARRTKINDALATLRNLVPVDAGRKLPVPEEESLDEDDDDDEFGYGNTKKTGKSKQKQEKEFKLEILDKAVLYVQELQEKVRVLEARGCARCSSVGTSSVHHHPKRKHETMPPSDDYDSNSSADFVADRPMKRLSSTQSILPHISPSQSTRLPSISSWLPLSITEQGLPESRTPLVNPVQLPTPPASGVIGPVASPQVPPALRLELPVASLSSKNTQSSPSWTPEDESAASLLLRFKTSTSPKAGKHCASVRDLLAPTPGAPRIGGGSRFMGVDEMRVQTPGSLLGMTTDGPK